MPTKNQMYKIAMRPEISYETPRRVADMIAEDDARAEADQVAERVGDAAFIAEVCECGDVDLSSQIARCVRQLDSMRGGKLDDAGQQAVTEALCQIRAELAIAAASAKYLYWSET